MSKPRVTAISRELRRDIERIAKEASATVTYERSGCDHVKIWLTREGMKPRYVTASSTSANWFRDFNILGDVKRTLGALGYVKPKAEAQPAAAAAAAATDRAGDARAERAAVAVVIARKMPAGADEIPAQQQAAHEAREPAVA